MKQFKTVFVFEYLGYIKNKTFQVMTITIMAILLIVSMIPQISSLISNLSGVGKSKTTAGYSLGENADSLVNLLTPEKMNSTVSDYNWEYIKATEDFSRLVQDGSYGAIFYYNGGETYDFYTTGRSISDYTAIPTLDSLVGEFRAEELTSDLGPDAKTVIQRLNNMDIRANHISVGGDFTQNYFLSYAMVFILYFALIFHNQFILTSVITEKSSKAMELLITSAKPTSLMFGKVIGVGAAALSQLLLFIITAVGLILLNIGSWQQYMPSVLSTISQAIGSPFLIASFVIFFILGYFIYAFFYAAVGSTVSRMEDANSVAIIPMPFIMIGFFASIFGAMSYIDSVWIKVLSYIPLFAPMVMFSRQCMNAADTWEIILSMCISVCGVFLMGFAAAKIYRTGVMLYGKAVKPKDILKMLMTK